MVVVRWSEPSLAEQQPDVATDTLWRTVAPQRCQIVDNQPSRLESSVQKFNDIHNLAALTSADIACCGMYSHE